MGNETNKEKKGKAAIVDEPMTPVPLDQRQHWITPAVIFGGLEFCVPILMIGATLIGAFGIKGMVPVVLFTFLVLTWAGNSVSGYIGAKTGLSSSVIARQGFGDKQAKFIIALVIGVISMGCLCGMDVVMLVNTVGRVRYDVLVSFGEYLTEKVQNADEIIVRDNNGTNLKAFNRGRRVKHSGQPAIKKGYPVMLGGQVSWCPVEETIEGTIVFDAALFPPDEIGLLKEEVRLDFKEGRVLEIKGGTQAEIFKRWLASFGDSNMYRLAHYSLGFNPGVLSATGRIVEDERIFGCIEFGIGSQGASLMGAFWNAASHTDGVVSKPTILLDGEVLEENGIYKEKTCVEYCKQLGVADY